MSKNNEVEGNKSNEVLDARAASSSANGEAHGVSNKGEEASCKKTSSSEVNKKTVIAIVTALVLAAIVVLCCVLAVRSLPGQSSSSQQAAEQSQAQASADNKAQNEEKSEDEKAQAETSTEYEYSYEWKSDGSASGSESSSEEVVPTSVTISVGVSGHGVSGGGTFTLPIGATAYDALLACGLSVNAKNTSYGIYVAAIGGLAEKDYGSKSGWLYAVNGNFPGIACSGFTLEDGDYVDWVYTDGD